MHPTIPVTLELEPQAAHVYQHISTEERKKLQYLFGLLLNEHKQLPSFLELLWTQ